MNTVTQALANYFDTHEFIHFPAKGAAIECLLDGHTGHWRCSCVPIDDPADRVMIVSRAPLIVPKPRRARCLELLNHINHRLVQGNYELKPGGGEVRYRDCVPLCNGELDTGSFHAAMAYGYNAFDRHLPALMGVAFGNLMPLRALELLDGKAKKTRPTALKLRADRN